MLTDSRFLNHLKGKAPALMLAAALLSAAVLVVLTWPSQLGLPNVTVGDRSPDFSLAAVRGGGCDLADRLAKQRTVLLSFVDVRSQPLSRTRSDPSRGQLVFLKSMSAQYAAKGLDVVIVACNGLSSRKPLAPGAVRNFSYDWQLDGSTVLCIDEGTAFRYGVFTLPTTFLIAPDGRIRRRWNGFAASAQLALAIESLVGPPPFRR